MQQVEKKLKLLVARMYPYEPRAEEKGKRSEWPAAAGDGFEEKYSGNIGLKGKVSEHLHCVALSKH